MARRMSRTGVGLGLLLGMTTPAAAQVEAQRWMFSASLRQSFTNDLFLIGPAGPGDAISSATLSLGFARLRNRSSFSASGWIQGEVFSRFKAYNGVQFGLTLSGETALQRPARLRYSAAYITGLNAEMLLASRIELPQVDIRAYAVNTGFNYEFTPRTSGHLSLDAIGIRYRANSLVASAQLPGQSQVTPDVLQPLGPGLTNQGPSLAPDISLEFLGFLGAEGIRVGHLDYLTGRAGGGLTHAFSPRTRINADFNYRRAYERPKEFANGEEIESVVGLHQVLGTAANLGVTYEYQDARFAVRTRTHSFQTQLDKRLGRRFKADLSLGASYLDLPSHADSGWTLIGGAGFLLQLKRTSIAARYAHTRYQGLILGRSLETDQFSASLGSVLGKRVFFSAFGYYHNARDAQDQGYSYNDSLVGASLGVRIQKWGFVGASYSYRRFDSHGLFPTVNSSFLSVPFIYSTTWK